MHTKKLCTTGAGLVVAFALLTVFLSPSGEAVQAFNQANLIRVAEVHEVDGEFLYRRVDPVYDIHP